VPLPDVCESDIRRRALPRKHGRPKGCYLLFCAVFWHLS
jgi:hypothetical protein